ncbi:Protein kintoun [Rhizophlyctis rosea]|nr:Protein kintoun [Rhizophlyctis rosea]
MMASSEGFKPTPDEIRRIEESMKDEKFKELFFDYMKEISDPENRKLYEAELAQLEAERGYNVRFVNPEPGFVVKTSTQVGRTMEKVFINICSSPEIKTATLSGTTTKGQNWSIPYSLNPKREDVDHANNKCSVYDCVFHPDTLKRAADSVGFRNMLISTALEGIDKQFKIQVDKKFKIPKMKSKGAIGQTVIRAAQSDQNKPTRSEETSVEFLERLRERQSQKEEPAAELLPKAQPSKAPLIQEISNSPADTTQQAAKPVETTPRFTIIHRGVNNDYQKYTNERNHQSGARPDAVVVKIELPGVSSAASVTLDTGDKTLDLHVPGKYKLHLPLPFPVLHEKGTAKFDKTKQTLAVTLPVVPAAPVVMETPDVPLETPENPYEKPPSTKPDSVVESDQEGESLAHEEPNIEAAVKSPQISSSSDTQQIVADDTNEVPSETTAAVQLELEPAETHEAPFTMRQNLETATIIVSVPSVKVDAMQTSFEGNLVTLQFQDAHGKQWKLHLETETPIDSNRCTVVISPENLVLLLQKRTPAIWKKIGMVQGQSGNVVDRDLDMQGGMDMEAEEVDRQGWGLPAGMDKNTSFSYRQRDDGVVEVHAKEAEKTEDCLGGERGVAEAYKMQKEKGTRSEEPTTTIKSASRAVTADDVDEVSVARAPEERKSAKGPGEKEETFTSEEKPKPIVKLSNHLIFELDD